MARKRKPLSLSSVRNRILGHREVEAKDLVPHPLNPRTHGSHQQQALEDLLDQVGVARSLLVYVQEQHRNLPDPPLTLIDGHLRASTLAGEKVTVEILDISDAEAHALLLSIDPLAQLAGYDQARIDELKGMVHTDSAALSSLWELVGAAEEETKRVVEKKVLAESYLILIECRDEAHQEQVLHGLMKEGLTCRAHFA